MELLVLSSLEKVFADEKPSAPEHKSFSMLKNERSSFQSAFCCENSGEIAVEISGKLADKSKIYFVKDVPVGTACYDDADDFYLRRTSGDYPDVLVPVDGKVKAEKGKWYSFWIEVSPAGEIGESELSVKISSENELIV